MRFKKIVQLFKNYSVSVSGSKGSGKDLLTANVIARRRKPHISNMKYQDDTLPFNYRDLDCGGNTYKELMLGKIKPYKFPYPDGTDVYLSDCGVYFPAQYNGELNKDYREFPTFMALSRHLGDCRVHINAQCANRTWDKIREQCDYYIRCRKSIVLFGKIVIQFVTTYDKYESALNRVRPCRIRVPFFNREAQMQARIYRDNFFNQHGEVKNRILIYLNRSKYDTRHFKRLLEGAGGGESK